MSEMPPGGEIADDTAAIAAYAVAVGLDAENAVSLWATRPEVDRAHFRAIAGAAIDAARLGQPAGLAAATVDMLGVAVGALGEIGVADSLDAVRVIAGSALRIIGKRLPGDPEWRLVSQGEPEPAKVGPKRFALVEQMGHRATVGTVRETTFAGKQMLAVTDLKTGSEHLVSPESLYEVTWLTEEQARSRVRPWTAVALPAADDDPWQGDDEDDDQSEPEE